MTRLRKPVPALFVLFALALLLGVGCGPKEQNALVIFVQEPVEARSDRLDGCRIAALRADGTVSVLTGEFTSAADPSVSFDGTRILFAGRRQGEAQANIWEMDLDGGNKRQLTRDLGDCAEPLYLVNAAITPPEFTDKVRWVGFTSTAHETYDADGDRPATALYVTTREPIPGRGLVTWQISFNMGSDFSPTVLRDGRILFASRRGGRTPLLTANWAGTGLNLFYEDLSWKGERGMACELPDRTVVFVESENAGPGGSGQLARVSLRRPLKTHERLSRVEGQYRTPQAGPDGRLVTAYRAGQDSYGLYYFDLARGGPGELIYDDPEWHDVDAQSALPRPEPQSRIPIVTDSRDTGLLYCLNVYESDRPEAADIAAGMVKRVRLIEGVPHPEGRKGRILGEAPVEEDGSFFVEVPADTPLMLQTLDASGKVLQSMEGWIWVRRGSRRGCIGCHENRELTPENRLVEAVRKGRPHNLLTPLEKRSPLNL